MSNCVIRFDPMIHSVSYVQGRGRARAADSSFVVLSERADRPAALLASIEQQQLDIIRKMEVPQRRDPADASSKSAQANRERSAREALLAATVNPNGVEASTVLATLNLFCKKTKVDLIETIESVPKSGEWSSHLIYESCLRKVEGRGIAFSKEAAKRKAAIQVVGMLARGIA